MADDLTLRTCGRTGCRWPAAASLSFRYGTGQVWLLDLSSEPDPSLYDLCPHHADALTVPKGWERVDQRSSLAAVAEPAGRDLDPRGGGPPPGVGGYGGNRYAALTAALPRLAREYRAEAGEPEGTADGKSAVPEATPDRDARAGDGPRPAAPARPSRDLAPMPVEETLWLPSSEHLDEPDEDGQDGRAVVVPIEARRRG